MNPDFMARLNDHLGRMRKALHRVSSDVPRGDDSISLEHVEQTRHTPLGREYAARDVARRICAAERADPERNGIEMNIDANLNVLVRGHGFLSSCSSIGTVNWVARRNYCRRTPWMTNMHLRS